MFRQDVLADRKSLHITCNKEVYLALRVILFKYETTIQQITTEFYYLLAAEDAGAKKILENYLVKRMERRINRKMRDKHKLPKKIIDDPKMVEPQEKNILYDVITERAKKNNDKSK